jgi:hypothetical protein
MRIVLISMMMSIVFVGFIHAEVVDISLPGICGFYSADSSYSANTRTADFTLSRIPTTVYDVFIRLIGVADTGLLNCEGAYGQRIIGPWDTDYDISMLDNTSGNLWIANFLYEDSSSTLDTTRTFWTNSGATWDFLINGAGSVTLRWLPMIPVTACSLLRTPNVIITEVHLIIDGEFPVPTENTTWGRIKEIYKEQ